MQSRLLVVLSVSVFALALLALSPLGEAAKRVVLPPGSVGTAQLKNNAVTSIKVKNRSLKAVDFARGQLPAGAQGAQGEQGPAGPAGPSNVYSVLRGGPSASIPFADTAPLATLTVPEAGKYLILAKATFFYAGGSVPVACTLAAGTTSIDRAFVQVDIGHFESLALELPHEFAAAGAPTLTCDDLTADVRANWVRISAIKTGELTVSTLP